ncbi:MAG: trypsin-like peptidase domain-containing protein [Isosphaeraceae bacterium]
MASIEEPHDQDALFDEPPPRPTTPPVRRGFLVVFLFLLVAAVLVYAIPYVAEQTGYAWESGRSRAAVETLAKLEKAGVVNRASELFRLATVAVSPAVVNIQTQRFRKNPEVPGGFPIGGPRFGRGPTESFGIGSGVVVDKENGYVVTNNHVIAEADQILVRLSQGAEVEARLVGADPKTDLAVLQIKGPLKVAAEWGDSDKIGIGDWVLAIGSPYMLDHTVTAGIVSATGRNNLALAGMDENGYQDFIQTDAAINPGNSGGPLIDLGGKIIGINTAILTAGSLLRGEDPSTSSGGFEGIGLAIPSSMARKVVENLIQNGKVIRGFLGVGVEPLDPGIAERLGLPDAKGAIVISVMTGSPAARAGLKIGDVIVRLGTIEIADASTLRNRASELTPGSEIVVEYYREGVKESTKLIVAELASANLPSTSPYGFNVREIPPGPNGQRPSGVFVDQVFRGSPGAIAGLRRGLKIAAVGETEVQTLEEFENAAAKYSLTEGLPLRVELPNGQSVAVVVGGPRRGR